MFTKWEKLFIGIWVLCVAALLAFINIGGKVDLNQKECDRLCEAQDGCKEFEPCPNCATHLVEFQCVNGVTYYRLYSNE